MGIRRFEIDQRLVGEAKVDLYDVDLTALNGPVLRWTPGPLNSRGRNLIANPSCLKAVASWFRGGTVLADTIGRGVDLGAAFDLKRIGSGYIRRSSLTGTEVMHAATHAMGDSFAAPSLPAGGWIEAQARVAPIRCRVNLMVFFYDSALAPISSTSETIETAGTEQAGGQSKADQVGDYRLLWLQAQIPPGTRRATLFIRARAVGGGSSTDPIVLWTMAQLALVSGPSKQPLPFLPASYVGSVRYGGITYDPVPIRLEGVRITGQGPIPRPRVTVPNINGFCDELMGTYKDMLGAPVTRRRVYARFLDGLPEADPTDYEGPDIWKISRVASRAPEGTTFELAAPIDMMGKKLPGNQIIRDVCTHSYRSYIPGTGFVQGTCPYAGASYWTAAGVPTGDPAADDCGRRLVDCGYRFPRPAALPTKAFPGVQRTQI